MIVSFQDVIDWDDQTIVGTSTQLEKPYLRLTSVSLFGFIADAHMPTISLPFRRLIRGLFDLCLY